MKPLSCQDVNPLLDAYADTELEGGRSAGVAAHLAGCPDCAQRLESIREMKSALRGAVARQPVPAALEGRIRSRITAKPPARNWFPSWPQFAVAAAAIALIALYIPWHRQVVAMLRIGAGHHVHCTIQAKNPLGKFNNDLADLGPEYKDLVARVSERMPAGARLLEAHHCSFRGRKFAHVVFGLPDNKLASVLVTRKKAGEGFPGAEIMAKMKTEGIPLYETDVDRLQSAGFETRGEMAYVVSNLSARENIELLAKLAPVIRGLLG